LLSLISRSAASVLTALRRLYLDFGFGRVPYGRVVGTLRERRRLDLV
jgi:hypothetical protein